MNWYLEVWRKGLDIHGRASRTEYWMFTLFNFIFVCCAAIMDNVVGTTFGYLPYGFIYLVYMVAVLIPSFTVTIRRLQWTVNRAIIVLARIPTKKVFTAKSINKKSHQEPDGLKKETNITNRLQQEQNSFDTTKSHLYQSIGISFLFRS